MIAERIACPKMLSCVSVKLLVLSRSQEGMSCDMEYLPKEHRSLRMVSVGVCTGLLHLLRPGRLDGLLTS